MADFIPVAELFATLGLDASELVEGLGQAKIRLADIEPQILSAQESVKMFAGTMIGAGLAVDDYTAALQKAFVDRKAQVAEQLAMEKAARDEAAEMRRVDLENEKAERARYQAWWARTLREQEAAVVESAQVEVEATETATGKMIVSNIKVRTEAQALNELAGTKIPGSLARLVAFSPTVAAALESIFDVVMVGAFLDIIYMVGEKIEGMTRDWEGFDAASIKAWDDARTGAEKAGRALQDYRDMQIDLNKAGLKGKEKDDQDQVDDLAKMGIRKEKIQSLQDEAKAMDALIQKAQGADGKGFSPKGLELGVPSDIASKKALDEIKDQGMTLEKMKDLYHKKIDELTQYMTEYGKLQNKAQQDEYKAANEKDKRNKLPKIPGAVDHEEPYKLPWYMGVSPAQSFAAQMRGVPDNQVAPTGGGGMPSSSSPSISEAMPDVVSPQGGSSKSRSGGSASVTIKNTYAPVFKFDGLPADVQKFVRETLEPMFIQDMQGNARGVAAEMIDALKKQGMGVTGG